MLWVLGLVLVGGAAWLALYGGRGTAYLPVAVGDAVSALLPERDRVRQALGDAAERYGFPRSWLEGLGWVESRWRLDALGDSGRSVGPTQIQRRTLANNGYQGDPDELRRDAQLAADWTGRLCLAGAKNAEGAALRVTPATAEDLAAWWNAGRQNYAELGPEHETRTDYAPKLIAAVAGLEEGAPLA